MGMLNIILTLDQGGLWIISGPVAYTKVFPIEPGLMLHITQAEFLVINKDQVQELITESVRLLKKVMLSLDFIKVSFVWLSCTVFTHMLVPEWLSCIVGTHGIRAHVSNEMLPPH